MPDYEKMWGELKERLVWGMDSVREETSPIIDEHGGHSYDHYSPEDWENESWHDAYTDVLLSMEVIEKGGQ